MRIQELDLKNFRGFTDFKVQFSPQFTVIAGINGQGKTAILEALALLISRLLPQISPAQLGYRYFEESDIHGNEDGTELLMKTNCAGIPVRYPGSYERIIKRQRFPKLPTRLQTEIRNAYGIDRTRSNDAAPIAVYYTTDRAGFSRPRNLSGKIQRGQAAAYHRALVKKQVNYKDLMQRYRVLAADAGADNPYFIGRRGVDVIERALQIFLDGFSNLRVLEDPPRLMVDKGRTPLDLAQLSDGQRSVLAMVSDLCKRLCQANPQIDPLSGEGVEHIQPKSLNTALQTTWSNFLLGCVNCNSSKGDTPIVLTDYYWPDTDNTLRAFEYTAGGLVHPHPGRTGPEQARAQTTMELTGLDKDPGNPDLNRRPTSSDIRWRRRLEAWDLAIRYKDKLAAENTITVREAIVDIALGRGLFSIWWNVFDGDLDIRMRLRQAFLGTNPGCFNTAEDAIQHPNGNI